MLKNSTNATLEAHVYGFNAASQRTSGTLLMTNHRDYGYDALGQLTSAKGFESSGGSRAQEQLTYGYDLAITLGIVRGGHFFYEMGGALTFAYYADGQGWAAEGSAFILAC